MEITRGLNDSKRRRPAPFRAKVSGGHGRGGYSGFPGPAIGSRSEKTEVTRTTVAGQRRTLPAYAHAAWQATPTPPASPWCPRIRAMGHLYRPVFCCCLTIACPSA